MARQITKQPKPDLPKYVEYTASTGDKVWVRGDNYEQDLTVVRDVLENDCYRLSEFAGLEYIVDVGSHIGSFAVLAHRLFPHAQVVTCECCPENMEILCLNAGWSNTVDAAITYEKDVCLLNAVFPNCDSTGGSIVCKPEAMNGANPAQYWPDTRPLQTKTLEDLVERLGLPRIDLLKLDCEGSEFSILRNTKSLGLVKNIVGEWHGKEEFMKLMDEQFEDWQFTMLKDGEFGLFWLRK
jgi:FkbM family methyltransferase